MTEPEQPVAVPLRADERLAKLREFLEDEGNYVGGVWGDYGQVVVDASMVWAIIDGHPHVWELSADYAATLNQAKEALEKCEESAALAVEAVRPEPLRTAIEEFLSENAAAEANGHVDLHPLRRALVRAQQ